MSILSERVDKIKGDIEKGIIQIDPFDTYEYIAMVLGLELLISEGMYGSYRLDIDSMGKLPFIHTHTCKALNCKPKLYDENTYIKNRR